MNSHYLSDVTYAAVIADIVERAKGFAVLAAGTVQPSDKADFEEGLKEALGEIGDIWPTSVKEDGE